MNTLPFEIRKLPSYLKSFYIVVSYTPSSEGWWMDGRDSDYYISDTVSPSALFIDGGVAEKISSFIANRKKNDDVEEGGDFFHLEADRIAQVLATRVNKIIRFTREWPISHKGLSLPFTIRRLDGIEYFLSYVKYT